MDVAQFLQSLPSSMFEPEGNFIEVSLVDGTLARWGNVCDEDVNDVLLALEGILGQPDSLT